MEALSGAWAQIAARPGPARPKTKKVAANNHAEIFVYFEIPKFPNSPHRPSLPHHHPPPDYYG